MFKIDQNGLILKEDGKPVRQRIIPGGSVFGTRIRPRRFLVYHFTAGWTADNSVDFWESPAADGANAHAIIDRDGTVIQCRPLNKTAGHAGDSKWADPKTGTVYRGLNNCSIGIELANIGDLDRSVYPRTMGPLAGKAIPRIQARHKNGGPTTKWEVYPDVQIAAAIALGDAICKACNLDDVVGHDDIAPDRKNDPGPAFPMAEVRAALGFPAR